jgi:hypothetical protein
MRTLVSEWLKADDDRYAQPSTWSVLTVPGFLMALIAHLDRNMHANAARTRSWYSRRSPAESRHLLDPQLRQRLEDARDLNG